jgi:hypothetical protein
MQLKFLETRKQVEEFLRNKWLSIYENLACKKTINCNTAADLKILGNTCTKLNVQERKVSRECEEIDT